MNKKKEEEKKQDENKLKKDYQQLKEQIEDYKNKYLRALADFQNLEKRLLEEKREFQKTANRDLLLKMIAIIDNIDKAEIFIKDKGLQMVKDSFLKLLYDEGVKEIQVLGKPFDPHLAEAIEVTYGKIDNIVTEVLRKGYYYYDEVLRPAQVKVSKTKNDKDSENKAEEQLS